MDSSLVLVGPTTMVMCRLQICRFLALVLASFMVRMSAVTQLTFVGEVRTGTNNVAIPVGLSALGSPLPYSGAISTGPVNLQVQDGDNVQTWNGSGWDLVSRDSLSGTGWTGASGDVAEPTLSVGQGFFYGNGVGAFSWQQILNNP